MRISDENITRLNKNEIFVYGSNLAGRHGKGAALTAYKKFGATWGRMHGMDNNSYGIPTKDKDLNTLPIDQISRYVQNFIHDAAINIDYTFYVTAIGTGLAGYSAEQIAPLFAGAIDLENVYLPQEFWNVLNKKEPI